MAGKKRILYVDDNLMDRALVRDSLEKEHGGFQLVEADSQSEFEKQITTHSFDLVLTDFNILGYEGLQVLEYVKANHPHIPVIIVTGTGSEEVAVEAMKRGASDYVIKKYAHIQRLPFVILNVLAIKQAEMERSRAQEALEENEKRLRMALEGTDHGIWDWDVVTGDIVFDDNWYRILGYNPRAGLFSFARWKKNVHPDSLPVFEEALESYCKGRKKYYELEYRMKDKSGRWRWIWARGVSVASDGQGNPLRMIGTHRDITEYKLAQEELKERMDELERFNMVMVGRENKMIELKKEIDALLVRLGEPKKYYPLG